MISLKSYVVRKQSLKLEDNYYFEKIKDNETLFPVQLHHCYNLGIVLRLIPCQLFLKGMFFHLRHTS